MTAEQERRRRREKEGVEAEEEGNGTSEMFPITGVEENRSCAWTDLRGRVEEKSVVYMQRLLFLATVCAERGLKRKRKRSCLLLSNRKEKSLRHLKCTVGGR